jgi:hypothetical protein
MVERVVFIIPVTEESKSDLFDGSHGLFNF